MWLPQGGAENLQFTQYSITILLSSMFCPLSMLCLTLNISHCSLPPLSLSLLPLKGTTLGPGQACVGGLTVPILLNSSLISESSDCCSLE